MSVFDENRERPLVLVAEDSLLNLELYRRVFETLPVRTIEAANGKAALARSASLTSSTRTIEAANGKAALAAIFQNRPDLLLIDLGLPVLSGLDVIRQVRMDRTFDTTKIIAITGQKNFKSTELSEAAVDAVIYKPFVIPDFVATLERLLAETAPSQGCQGTR